MGSQTATKTVIFDGFSIKITYSHTGLARDRDFLSVASNRQGNHSKVTSRKVPFGFRPFPSTVYRHTSNRVTPIGLYDMLSYRIGGHFFGFFWCATSIVLYWFLSRNAIHLRVPQGNRQQAYKQQSDPYRPI